MQYIYTFLMHFSLYREYETRSSRYLEKLQIPNS